MPLRYLNWRSGSPFIFFGIRDGKLVLQAIKLASHLQINTNILRKCKKVFCFTYSRVMAWHPFKKIINANKKFGNLLFKKPFFEKWTNKTRFSKFLNFWWKILWMLFLCQIICHLFSNNFEFVDKGIVGIWIMKNAKI